MCRCICIRGYGIVNDTTPNGEPKSWFANILTGGEGWHKNPTIEAKIENPNKWWQIDNRAYFIKLIKR